MKNAISVICNILLQDIPVVLEVKRRHPTYGLCVPAIFFQTLERTLLPPKSEIRYSLLPATIRWTSDEYARQRKVVPMAGSTIDNNPVVRASNI
jgi:hypothetical protein